MKQSCYIIDEKYHKLHYGNVPQRKRALHRNEFVIDQTNLAECKTRFYNYYLSL
jgi:hypothetical protein